MSARAKPARSSGGAAPATVAASSVAPARALVVDRPPQIINFIYNLVLGRRRPRSGMPAEVRGIAFVSTFDDHAAAAQIAEHVVRIPRDPHGRTFAGELALQTQ